MLHCVRLLPCAPVNLDRLIPWAAAPPPRCGRLLWEPPRLARQMYYLPASHVFTHSHRQRATLCTPKTQRHTCWSEPRDGSAAQPQTGNYVLFHSRELKYHVFNKFLFIRFARHDKPCWLFLTEILIRRVGERSRREQAYAGGWELVVTCWPPFSQPCRAFVFSRNVLARSPSPDICHFDPAHRTQWDKFLSRNHETASGPVKLSRCEEHSWGLTFET